MSAVSKPASVVIQAALALVRTPLTMAKYMVPMLLLMTLLVGMNHGAVADTRADAHLDEHAMVDDMDYSEQETNPVEERAEGTLPGWMQSQTEPDPRFQAVMDHVMLLSFTLAEEVALFTYDQSWIQAWWAAPVLQLVTLAYLGWMLYETAFKHLINIPGLPGGESV